MLVNEYAEDTTIYSFVSSADQVSQEYAEWVKHNPDAYIIGIEITGLSDNRLAVTLIYRWGE